MASRSWKALLRKSPLRIFAVFAIGIILPSLFLSYLGFRSFQLEWEMKRSDR